MSHYPENYRTDRTFTVDDYRGVRGVLLELLAEKSRVNRTQRKKLQAGLTRCRYAYHVLNNRNA